MKKTVSERELEKACNRLQAIIEKEGHKMSYRRRAEYSAAWRELRHKAARKGIRTLPCQIFE